MHFKYFSVSEIQNFLAKNNLSVNKKYGQNFLINSGVVDTIIRNANITENDLVFEIGSGLGSLTHKIIGTGCLLVGFEVDNAYMRHLNSLFGEEKKVSFVHGDFLKEITDTAKKFDTSEYNNVFYMGNIPYNITSPILEKIFMTPLYFDHIIFMMQKEVAERITAKPGTSQYGRLSIFCQYNASAKIIAKLSPKSFYPQPKIESAIVHFKKLENHYDVRDQAFFYKVVNSIFLSRRKQIKNNLFLSPVFKNVERDSLLKALNDVGISPSERAEKLSVSQIVDLSNSLFNTLN